VAARRRLGRIGAKLMGRTRLQNGLTRRRVTGAGAMRPFVEVL